MDMVIVIECSSTEQQRYGNGHSHRQSSQRNNSAMETDMVIVIECSSQRNHSVTEMDMVIVSECSSKEPQRAMLTDIFIVIERSSYVNRRH